MSLLQYFSRPLVAFDPANRQHRQWFHEFQVKRTWGHCPVRFIIPDETGNLVTLCQRRLIDYYVGEEFGKNNA